jgi:hypothetical protein
MLFVEIYAEAVACAGDDAVMGVVGNTQKLSASIDVEIQLCFWDYGWPPAQLL